MSTAVFMFTLCCALFNTGAVFIAYKFGIVELYEVYKRRWMPKKCEFCLFFWMALVELCIRYAIHRTALFEWGLLSIPPLALCAAVVSVFVSKFNEAIDEYN